MPLSVGELGPLSNTMSPGPRPTSVPSGILIHPTIWPQYTGYRQTDRTNNGPIAYGEPPKNCNFPKYLPIIKILSQAD